MKYKNVFRVNTIHQVAFDVSKQIKFFIKLLSEKLRFKLKNDGKKYQNRLDGN
jgi:hypothetical protein